MNEISRLEQTNTILKNLLLKLLPQELKTTTIIEGLSLSRRDQVRPTQQCFFQPTIAIVVQGEKLSKVGNKDYQYGEQQCMVVGVNIPGVYHITKASPEKPFLAVSIKLNPYIISQLLGELPIDNKHSNQSPSSVVVSKVPLSILDSFVRLVELLDNPSKAKVLAPMIIREIHLHLLTELEEDCLRVFCTTGTKGNQIAHATNWLREHYAEPLDVEELANRVNMSASSFFRHFRQVTTLSPLQFQKQLRLYEAERLMMQEGKHAGTAAIEVGYESESQFNREYKRQFGEPPHRNISKKMTGSLATATTVSESQ